MAKKKNPSAAPRKRPTRPTPAADADATDSAAAVDGPAQTASEESLPVAATSDTDGASSEPETAAEGAESAQAAQTDAVAEPEPDEPSEADKPAAPEPVDQDQPAADSTAEAPEDVADGPADEETVEDDADQPVTEDDDAAAEEMAVEASDETVEDQTSVDADDDGLDLPWFVDEEETSAASSSASRSRTTATDSAASYTPPPPYDPNALPKAPRQPQRPPVVDEATSAVGGADYMLADAMPAATTKKRSKTPLLVGAAAIVIALVVGIIWAAPSLFPGMFGASRNTTPKAAVEAYLGALARGDAAAAIKTAVTAPGDTTMLTNAVLAASQQQAPLTNISVAEVSGTNSATVSASYQLGGKPVTANFATQRVGDEWRLTTITHDLQLTGIDHVSATLNGTPMANAHVTLFPGSYVVTSTNDRLTINGGQFVITSPSDFATPTLNVSISSKGIADARTAAQAYLSSCVKKRELAPSGCGFGVTSAGVKVKSVTWTITSGASAFKKASFRAESTEPYVATVYPYIQLKATVTDSSGRRYSGMATITTVKADLSGSDVVITFNQ